MSKLLSANQVAPRKSWALLVGTLCFIALAVLPLIPAIPDFRLALLGRFLCYAIFAIGIDLIWGYTGILSLGHGVYFGLGAYCTAMYLKLEASGGKMPDFMAWSGVDTMPTWWQPFQFPIVAILGALLVPTIFATALGFFSFRSRVTGVFFSILSQALAVVMVTLFIGQQGFTGGTNGMTDFKTVLGHDLNSTATQHVLYWITLVALVAVYFGARALVNGKIGRILVAVRDGENRVRFTGYDPAAYKIFVYALSALFAGLAGMLFVLQVGLITPSQMDITNSIKAVLWVAIGGRGTLIGAVIGALLVSGGETFLSESFPTQWQYFLGFGFLLTVLFMPRGIVGLWRDLNDKWIQRKERTNEQLTGKLESQPILDN